MALAEAVALAGAVGLGEGMGIVPAEDMAEGIASQARCRAVRCYFPARYSPRRTSPSIHTTEVLIEVLPGILQGLQRSRIHISY